MARSLGKQGKKVLLIDCDFNLGNCGFALGLKSYKTILDHVKGEKLKDVFLSFPYLTSWALKAVTWKF